MPLELEPNPFIRFKVEIDITKPLQKGFYCHFGGDSIWISLRYESLPSYCYCCGVVGHFFKMCSSYDRDANLGRDELSYGPSVLKAQMTRKTKGYTLL